MVNLSSNSGAATVPNTVTVPAGSTGTTFTVTTSAVNSTTVATIGGELRRRCAAGAIDREPCTAPGFTLSASPSSLTITRGSNGNSTITVTKLNEFNSAITFSASGVPSRTSVSFSPNNTTASSTTMTIKVNSRATRGTYTITVNGSGGGTSAATQLSLTIQ